MFCIDKTLLRWDFGFAEVGNCRPYCLKFPHTLPISYSSPISFSSVKQLKRINISLRLNLIKLSCYVLMKILKTLHKGVLKFDLLNSSANLRVRGEGQYQTFFGGMMSIALLLAFGFVFYSSFLLVFQRQSISYTQSFADDPTSQDEITQDNIQMAVGIRGVDLSGSKQKFAFLFEQIEIDSSTTPPTQTMTPLFVSPCDLSKWTDVGSYFSHQFQAFGMDKMLCITSGQNFSITGYTGSTIYKYLTFKILLCNASFANCESTSAINTFLSTYLASNDFFKVQFYLVNTIISPDQPVAINKIIEKNIFMAFTQTTGTSGLVNLASYSLITDNSILPYTDPTTDTGAFIDNYQSNSISINSDHYIEFSFYKSTTSLTISRSLGKLDQTLSYVGGLFGLLFGFIAFFCGNFAQYKYELYVGSSAFCYDDSGRKINENDMGFITFFMYAIYDWLKAIGCAPKCWKRMKQIDDTREEANSQLDVSLILKRIRNLEATNRMLISEHRQICLYLSKPLTIDESRRFRDVLNYYDKFIEELPEEERQTLYFGDQKQRPLETSLMKKYPFSNEKAFDGLLKLAKLQKNHQTSSKIEQVDEEFEQKMVKRIIFDSIHKLEEDNKEGAVAIRHKIPQRFRELFKQSMAEQIKEADGSQSKLYQNSFENLLNALDRKQFQKVRSLGSQQIRVDL